MRTPTAVLSTSNLAPFLRGVVFIGKATLTKWEARVTGIVGEQIVAA
jgi:hypothetical protein